MYLRVKNSKHGNAGTPYYVGKGKGMRAYSKNRRVRPPEDKSRIVFVVRSLSEEDAHSEEKRLIAVYGRIDNGTGCLRNLTDGGEGQCGVRLSQKRRDEISRRMIGKKYALGWRATEEQKAKLSFALKGKSKPPRSAEHIKNACLAQLGKKQSPETIEKRVSRLRGKSRPPFNEEWKHKISEGKKGCKPNSGSFHSGIVPWNANTAGTGVMKPNRTSFKKGMIPWNKKAEA